MPWTLLVYDPDSTHATADTVPPDRARIERWLVTASGHSAWMTGEVRHHTCNRGDDCPCGGGTILASMADVRPQSEPPPGVEVPDGVGDWWRPA